MFICFEISEITIMADTAASVFSNSVKRVLAKPSFNKCSVKKNKQLESRIGYCTKYNKLDRTKIAKCYHCNNIVDLTKERLSQQSLCSYGKLSETYAVQISYICNHCCATLDLIKSLQEQLESNTKRYDCL